MNDSEFITPCRCANQEQNASSHVVATPSLHVSSIFHESIDWSNC